MTNLGRRLMQAAEEARAIARGEMEPARIYVPENVDVKAIRGALKMTQETFSNTFGFPLGTVRDWEQHKSTPDTSARAYLLVISKEPEVVTRALRASIEHLHNLEKPPGPKQRRAKPASASGRKPRAGHQRRPMIARA